ncbi:MAG TPA: hypothetical protein VFW22_05755 [Pseudolabrys sp.]|nr:hypothetical protein [Pseudolabrys sp.]
MVSGVVLSMSWVELTLDAVRARLDKVFPGEFLPPRGEGTFVIEGPLAPEQYFVNSAIAGASGTFFLNSVPDRYAEVSNFANLIADEKLRALALAQEAWLSVDLIDSRADPAAASRFICKTLAEFAPPDAVVLVHSYDHTIYFDAGVRERLASGTSPL